MGFFITGLPTALSILVSFLVPLHLASTPPYAICTHHTTFPHLSVHVVFSPQNLIQVPLTIYYRCTASGNIPITSRRRALLPLFPGALARASDYSALATVLARRGFVVAIPQYDSRRFIFSNPVYDIVVARVNQSRAQGFDCPPNAQLASAKLLASALSFLAGHELRADLRALYDVRNVLLFGHSVSGELANFLFNDNCEPVKDVVEPPPQGTNTTDPTLTAEIVERVACELYAKKDLPPSMHIRGIVAFEGFNQNSDIRVTAHRFVVQVYSGFFDDKVDQFFTAKDFGGRLALVRIGVANHYGPNNFVEENKAQRPVCMLVRPSPEDEYVTTRARQRRILRSIAATIVVAYSRFGQLSSLIDKSHLEVDNITYV